MKDFLQHRSSLEARFTMVMSKTASAPSLSKEKVAFLAKVLQTAARNPEAAGGALGLLRGAGKFGRLDRRLGGLAQIRNTLSKGDSVAKFIARKEAAAGRKFTKAELKQMLTTEQFRKLGWHKRARKASKLQGKGLWNKTDSSIGFGNLRNKYKNFGQVIGEKKAGNMLFGTAKKGMFAGAVARPFLKNMAAKGTISAAARRYGPAALAGGAVGVAVS